MATVTSGQIGVATGPTTRRPEERSVEIVEALCKQCGICVGFCPRGNLSIVQGLLQHEGECTGCGLCELHCPDDAIFVRKRAVEGGDAIEVEAPPSGGVDGHR